MAASRTLVLAAALLWIAGAASGYEGAAVANGGSIKGTVSASNKGRKDETLTIAKDTGYCGTSLPAEKYLISPQGRLKNSVVMIEGITSGKPLDTSGDFFVTNHKCRFVPHVMVAPKGGMLKAKNDDPLLHNSHFFLVAGDAKKNVINLALPKLGVVIGKKKILR